MNNMYRVMVKMNSTGIYNAIALNKDGDVCIASNTNVLYHSFFNKDDAEKLKKELEEVGYDTVVRLYKSRGGNKKW